MINCTNNAPQPIGATIALENQTMKTWFDSNCSRCHASNRIASADWLYNPADFNESIQKYLPIIYNEVVVEAVMPEDKALSVADMVDFKAWYKAGAPSRQE